MPARPADFLSPASHKQRRELLRAQLLAHGTAVVFAAPVRNRANDADYVYHQNPDLHYPTGYDEPDAVLLLFKESRTVGAGRHHGGAVYLAPPTTPVGSGPTADWWAPPEPNRSWPCNSLPTTTPSP